MTTIINRNAAATAQVFFLLVVLLIATTSVSVDGFSASGGYALQQPTTTSTYTTTSTSTTLAASTVADDIIVAEDETTAVAAPKSWADDGFVFGLEGSGLERPKGKVAQVVVEGDSLPSTNEQRAVVWSTLAGHAGIAAFSIMGMMHGNDAAFSSFAFADNDVLTIGVTALQALMVTVVSWTVADFGSGILHWSVDNYGNGRTPVMGGIIAAFQGHHSAQWTICEREFENNVSKLCIPFGVQTVLAMKLLFGLGPVATYFWTVFCVMEIMSQEFHKMAHMTKSEAGPVWNTLQDVGVTIDRKSHARHHIAPYDGNYCIVSGRCNKLLDESGFLRRMEHMVYKINGIESNAWKLDAKLRERTLNGEYVLANSVRTARKQ